MSVLQAIVLAIVQGLTEFIPISSSGHLVLVREFLHWPDVGGVFVDTVLHVASLLAILLYFWKDWVELVRSLVSGGNRLLLLLVVATLPAVLVGPYLETKMDVFRDGGLIGMIMIGAAAWYLVCETREGRRPKPIGRKVALFMGIIQVVALLPGASRSGLTIGAAIFCGRKREDAARFSFLMAVPTILGAMVLEAGRVLAAPVDDLSVWAMLIGFFVCFVVSLASIRFCMGLFKRHSLVVFSVYLVIVGLVLLLLRYGPWTVS